ncbi:MAG: ferritin family protein [Bacteroidia bacterium]|nr:ferritin family protein [Bacteroidia bacterium]
MEESKTLEILKTAILLERKGKAFYSSVAEKATDPDVKIFFRTMAEEEEDHVNFLTEQFASYTKTKAFKDFKVPVREESTDELILSDKLKKQIAAASFEAAAISSAIDMENRAILVYQEQADRATDPKEKVFYRFLADWEKGHHHILHEIDEQLKEKVWNDNSFWPF